MKRLSLPKIPTRIPVPNIPAFRKTKGQPEEKISVPEKTNVEQASMPLANTETITEEQSTNKRSSKIPLPSLKPGKPKFSLFKLPAPRLPKTGVPKISKPNIPLPSIPKPGIPKISAPNIPLPSIPIPGRQKKDEADNIVVPAAPPIKEVPAAIQQDEPKGKPKLSLSHMHMPSLHKTSEKAIAAEVEPQSNNVAPHIKAPEGTGKLKKKLSMPSLSLGGGGAKATDKRILSLTIEGTNIRTVIYHKNAIESWNSIPFDPHLIKMGQVADAEGFGEVIKTALKDIEPSKCYVVCALPGLRSVSRIINIPNVSKKEMEVVIPREVRRTMTVSEEDNYFHWQVLPTTTAQTRVFVLAVPKEPLSSLLRALNQANMRPKSIDLKPLALMRAVNQRDAIIANCESNSMELVIVSDDVPVLIRSVFLGEGVVTPDYAVGRISDELGRTIVTYNEINKEHPLDPNVPIYLTGAAAAGVPFALNVAALTGRTVQPLEAPMRAPEGFPLAEYMVNLGLILKVL
jgi:hypothetical protein